MQVVEVGVPFTALLVAQALAEQEGAVQEVTTLLRLLRVPQILAVVAVVAVMEPLELTAVRVLLS
jgi:hypothetical protein